MKKTLIILSLSWLFLGCSSKNAFDNFSITPEQEIGEKFTQSSKIKQNEITQGIVSIIYLNKVYPKLYKDAEYFYICSYSKVNFGKLNFMLNGSSPLSIKNIKDGKELINIRFPQTNWQEEYIVSFALSGDMLKLIVKNGPFASDILTFEKDEQ